MADFLHPLSKGVLEPQRGADPHGQRWNR